jgi:hypothetical protein
MSNKFTIIQQANNEHILKYDMGLSYYKGVINVNSFCVELQSNHIDVVKEAIKYFLVESKNEPKIMSMFQYPETSEVNNFMISFEMKKDFINIQRFINIEMFKVTKTIDDYMFELDYRIKENANLIKDNLALVNVHENKIIELEKKNVEYENEIKKLKESVDLLNQNINKLSNPPKLENNSFNNQTNLFSNPPLSFKETSVQQSKFIMPSVNNNLNAIQTPKVENNIFTPGNPLPNNNLIFAPLPPVVKTDNIFNLGNPPVKNSNQQLTITNPNKS